MLESHALRSKTYSRSSFHVNCVEPHQVLPNPWVQVVATVGEDVTFLMCWLMLAVRISARSLTRVKAIVFVVAR